MIAIVDYGMGNLRSVQKAFEKTGVQPVITSDPQQLADSSKVILPGVGAFQDAMHELRQRNLIDVIVDSIHAGKPFLGICLGLQLLFDFSDEGGRHPGLGIFPGGVVRFNVPTPLKIPHMGWNQVSFRSQAPILQGIPDESYFYFVHSYYAAPSDRSVVAGESTYDQPFTAMVWRENVFATQFHPEKSQSDGLTLLRNFAAL